MIKIRIKKRIPISPFLLNLSEEAGKWKHLGELLKPRIK